MCENAAFLAASDLAALKRYIGLLQFLILSQRDLPLATPSKYKEMLSQSFALFSIGIISALRKSTAFPMLIK